MLTPAMRFVGIPFAPSSIFLRKVKALGLTTSRFPSFKKKVARKESGEDVPVCYCFGWTRRRIWQELQGSKTPQAILEGIADHIKARGCGCQVNNPQGFCCLENVRQVILEMQQRKAEEQNPIIG